jgi:hypothetical protein
LCRYYVVVGDFGGLVGKDERKKEKGGGSRKGAFK